MTAKQRSSNVKEELEDSDEETQPTTAEEASADAEASAPDAQPTNDGQEGPGGSGENSDEDEEEVEDILDVRRSRDGQLQYMCKWKNYAYDECEWVDEDDAECPEVKAAFIDCRREAIDWPQCSREEFYTKLYGNAWSSQPRGVERGLEPAEIIGATEELGELGLAVRWVGEKDTELVPAWELGRKYPRKVIDFYQSRVYFEETASTATSEKKGAATTSGSHKGSSSGSQKKGTKRKAPN